MNIGIYFSIAGLVMVGIAIAGLLYNKKRNVSDDVDRDNEVGLYDFEKEHKRFLHVRENHLERIYKHYSDFNIGNITPTEYHLGLLAGSYHATLYFNTIPASVDWNSRISVYQDAVFITNPVLRIYNNSDHRCIFDYSFSGGSYFLDGKWNIMRTAESKLDENGLNALRAAWHAIHHELTINKNPTLSTDYLLTVVASWGVLSGIIDAGGEQVRYILDNVSDTRILKGYITVVNQGLFWRMAAQNICRSLEDPNE